MLLNCDVEEDSWRVPWTARRSNQSILRKISPGCSLEGLMLKLKLQYFGHLMLRADSFEKTLMLGKIEVGRRSKAPFSSRSIKDTYHHLDLSLLLPTWVGWLRQSLSGFSMVKLIFPLALPHCIRWKEVNMCSPHWRGGSYSSSPWELSIYIYFLKFLWHGDFRHSLIQSFMCITMDSYPS